MDRAKKVETLGKNEKHVGRKEIKPKKERKKRKNLFIIIILFFLLFLLLFVLIFIMLVFRLLALSTVQLKLIGFLHSLLNKLQARTDAR